MEQSRPLFEIFKMIVVFIPATVIAYYVMLFIGRFFGIILGLLFGYPAINLGIWIGRVGFGIYLVILVITVAQHLYRLWASS